jgi:hypothetical protein
MPSSKTGGEERGYRRQWQRDQDHPDNEPARPLHEPLLE